LKNLERKDNILLAFYGDDFTGSTDALEFICRSGARAMLFIEPPGPEQLGRFPELDVFGVAGKTRSLPAEQLGKQLLADFEKIRLAGPRHVHYKVCSTFDSSPSIGSIGKAIDCGAAVFANPCIPVFGGTPALGRYCVFGNLFARMGTGGMGNIFRLDRHPSMSSHPVTPATESDLRRLLGGQTKKKTGLIDVLQLARPVTEWTWQTGDEVVVIDALSEADLLKAGEWMDGRHNGGTPLFSVGSSAVEMALGAYWSQDGLLRPVTSWPAPAKADGLLVVSGSCSPVTAAQIAWAKAHGFAELVADPAELFSGESALQAVSGRISDAVESGKPVVMHTGQRKDYAVSSEKLGGALGALAKEAVRSARVKRVVIAGGDTSSYAARALDIEALEMISPLVTGAPLCRAHSKNAVTDGLEVNFKGGQVGEENYFGVLLEGSL
jgi:uncharacterized protein YgbK (DUF1537 family)